MGSAPASTYVCARSAQTFIHDSWVAHLVEEDQGKVTFYVPSLAKTLNIF